MQFFSFLYFFHTLSEILLANIRFGFSAPRNNKNDRKSNHLNSLLPKIQFDYIINGINEIVSR